MKDDRQCVTMICTTAFLFICSTGSTGRSTNWGTCGAQVWDSCQISNSISCYIPNTSFYSFSQLLTHKKRKFGTICTTFTSCTNRSTQFGTTSHSLICIRLWFSLFTLWCQLHITLLSKHYTQCSVVAHTSQVKSQSINLQHTNSQISKHSGRLSNLQWGLQHKSALSLCFVW